jgi:electron transfer flavoprotein alpha subunit
MSGVLVISETRRGALREISLELIGAAVAIRDHTGGPVTVGVIDAAPDRFIDALSVTGVDELLLVPVPGEHAEAHVSERAISQLISERHPGLVLLGHTVDALGVGPAVAVRRGLGFASDVTAIGWDRGPVASRGAFGDKLRNELEFPNKESVLLMLRPGSYAPATGAGSPAVWTVELDLAGAARTEHLGFRDAEVADVDITKAPFLLAIGRGVEDEDNVARFEELADRVGAVLSVSRPLVDAGWVSSARQVGQSGRTVKPRVYLALGISGAIQHLAGMRSSETIIAVNTDPEAPIFGVAHYGVVTDMFELADELERVLA